METTIVGLCASHKAQIEQILASCPVAGEGVNTWLFSAALKLHRLGLDPQTIEELLQEGTWDCGRDMKPDEIERAVPSIDANVAPEIRLRLRTGPKADARGFCGAWDV